jgi:predicted dehydrogenase
MKPIRIGIIGIGNMGSAHVQSIGEGHIKGLYLCAVADIDPTRLAWVKGRFPAVQCFDSAQALLESGVVDAVIIATPHWLHPEIAVQAMERGLHVLTEKPAGVAVSQVRRMIETHERTGKVFDYIKTAPDGSVQELYSADFFQAEKFLKNYCLIVFIASSSKPISYNISNTV